MSWWKRLLGGPEKSADNDASNGQAGEQIYIAPRSEIEARAEDWLPGTADIPAILQLVPPPVDLALAPDLRPDRDYAPDPIATHRIEWPAAQPFGRRVFRAALSSEELTQFGQPTLYARLPNGRITFLTCGDDDEFDANATAIIAAWDLSGEVTTVSTPATGIAAMSAWLATRSEGFAVVHPDESKLRQQWDHAQAIIAVLPQKVEILAQPRHGSLDGRTVWRTLHAMGITWGDMDQFQWADPTQQADYLFWAAVDDGDIGYADPGKIAAGTQHFHGVHFFFDVARSPAPQHVLGEMQRAAAMFATTMNCDLIYLVDQVEVAGLTDLEVAVAGCIRDLQELGVKHGSSSVCQLR